jgi:acyl carrier protein
MDEITKKVQDILVEKLGIASTEVTPDANLIKDLGIDSLDYAELVMEFEQTFDIRIPDSDAEQLSTVSQTVKYIGNKLEEKQSQS